ncbi:MAG: glycosyltransferase [Firmicutes bacterium]|nr:glycosyltransferase [Bacillota bacterium]
MRNEETTLARCLKSVQEIADDLVVVDTGSTDGTTAVARSFEARVFEFPWQGDFSAARNFALEQVDEEWTLVIDADEELHPSDRNRLVELLQNTRADAVSVEIHNILGTPPATEVMVGHSVRILRTDRRYRYTGIIHEDVTPSIQAGGGRVYISDIKFLHSGYRQDNEKRAQRHARNVTLLQKALAHSPHDPKALFELGTEYYVENQFELAAQHYEQSFRYCPSKAAYRPRLLRNYIAALNQIGRHVDGYRLVVEALSDYPDYADLWFLRGVIERNLSRLDDAVGSFGQAIAASTRPSTYETNRSACREKAHLNLAEMFLERGNAEEALEHAMACLAINPSILPAYTVAAKAFVAQGKLLAAREVLEMARTVSPGGTTMDGSTTVTSRSTVSPSVCPRKSTGLSSK